MSLLQSTGPAVTFGRLQQRIILEDTPAQSFPPYTGEGLRHSLLIHCVCLECTIAPLHTSEHWTILDHSAQAPLTLKFMNMWNIRKIMNYYALSQHNIQHIKIFVKVESYYSKVLTWFICGG